MRKSLLVALLFLFSLPQVCLADKLKDLMQSPEYKDAVRIPFHSKRKSEDDGSNYYKLFQGKGEKASIFKALGLEFEGYSVVSSQITKREQYISAYRAFRPSRQKARIDTYVVIPRAAYTDLFEQGLILEANNFKPHASDIASKGPAEIAGEHGEVWQLENGKTYIFIHLPRHAYFIASTEKSKDASFMTKLLQSFTFGELKRQLES